MTLFIVRDIVKDCVIILFIIVLETIASNTIKTIPNYIFIVFSSIIILIISKTLYNIIITVK